nr:leucyl aminopeptidase [Novosphingopyxis sp. YJ-S2-01]
MIDIRFSADRPQDADVLVIPVGEGGADAGALGIAQGAMVAGAAKSARFEGKAGQSFSTFAEEDGSAVRVLLVGTGKDGFDKAGGAISAQLLTSGAKHASLKADGLSAEQAAEIAYGAKLRSWRIDTYRTQLKDHEKPSLTALTLVGAPDGTEDRWTRLDAIAEGVAFTRELVSEPANIIYPESFVERARAKMEPLGVTLRVLDEPEMEKLGMNALLGVSMGSEKPGRLLALEYMGGKDGEKPIVFVGKGVTFDTGGISLKAPQGMEDMKWDMGGAGAVAGAMTAIAGRKAKANVIGICGLVENMPDGKAQRPGDVVTSMSGQTIEVINTDAEGRLVLCDALHWAQETYDPEYIVDLATLTGAMLVSLGHEQAGLFSNDDGLADKLTAAGKTSGDPLWRLPLGKAYDKLLDSPIADMKNVGPRSAGSITAAQFLQRFIQDGVKWAHLDIAGMAWADKDSATAAKGATGFGVRLLDRLIADNFEG